MQWMRAAIAVLLLVPVTGIAVLGGLTFTELGEIEARRKTLRDALSDARDASTQVVKASHLDRTLGIAGEVDRMLKGTAPPDPAALKAAWDDIRASKPMRSRDAAQFLGVSECELVASEVGVGATRRLSAVRWGVARQIVWAWVMTIPAAFAIGAGVYTLLSLSGAR